MAAYSENILINSLVKVDGQLKGRVIDIVQPLGTFNVYTIKTDNGRVQVPRYRLQLIPETVSVRRENDYDFFIPQEVADDLMNDDFFDAPPTNSRFRTVTNSDISSFLTENENENTLKKTKYDLAILDNYMRTVENDNRQIHDIPPIELNDILSRFFMSVRKTNSEEYQPSTLRGMLASFDRHLKHKNYGKCLATDPIFGQMKAVLTSKQKQLKRDGKGNLPNRAEPLSDEEVEKLWSSKQLGSDNPESIINTLWWQNTVHFGMRSCTPHRNLCWGDITLKTDTNGLEFLEMCERQTKTRTGSDPRNTRNLCPRVWENTQNPDRCPVVMFKLYKSLRPSDFCKDDSPFYLATACKCKPLPGQNWFKRQPIGRNKLGAIMKNMVSKAGITGDKHLTNHSARKHLIQKLQDNAVPPTHIMQLSGHKNVQSVNNYSRLSDAQHRNIGSLLSAPTPANRQLSLPDSRDIDPFPVNLGENILPSKQNSQVVSVQNNNKAISSEIIRTIFAGPIYGGVFNISIGNTTGATASAVQSADHPSASEPNPNLPKRRRICPVVFSDSSDDE